MKTEGRETEPLYVEPGGQAGGQQLYPVWAGWWHFMWHPGLTWGRRGQAWDVRPELGREAVPLPVQGPVTAVTSAAAPGDRAV